MFREILKKIASIQHKIQARSILRAMPVNMPSLPRHIPIAGNNLPEHDLRLELLQLKTQIIARIGKEKRAALRTIIATIRHNKLNHAGNQQNVPVMQLLLPIVELAHLYENHGIPSEHAYKLAMVFDNHIDAIKYLTFYANEKQNCTQPVHDACFFTLPPADYDFSTWQKISPKYMQFAWFRQMLPHAHIIEKSIVSANAEELLVNKTAAATKLAATELKTALTEVTRIKKEYKFLRDKRVKGQPLTTAESLSYYDYAQTLLNAQFKLVTASAWLVTSVANAPAEVLQAHYTKYMADAEAFKFFAKHSLTQKNYAKFNSLKCVDSDAIPNIKIDGSSIGYPGYYLRRLNVTDRKDAAMAACLGKLSSCCQSLSDEFGEPCAIHGLTSPNGGFYVVCQGNLENPSIYDPLICQSWVWLSTSGALVVDSVESSYKNTTDPEKIYELIRTFYYQLTAQLIATGIPQVCLGMSSGISKVIDEIRISTSEKPINYTGTRDSYVQHLLADKHRLYLLPGCEDYFLYNCHSANLPATAPEYMAYLGFAITNLKHQLLAKYSQQFPDNIGEKIISTARNFIALLNSTPFNQEQIKDLIIDNANLLTLTNDKGKTTLLLALEHGEVELLKWMISNHHCDVNSTDTQGNTLLLLALQYNQWPLIQWLVEQNIAGNLLFSLNIRSNINATLLMIATANNQFELVKLLVSNSIAGKINFNLTATDKLGYTALAFAAAYDHLPILQWLYEQRLDGKPIYDLNRKNNSGCNILMLAVSREMVRTVTWLCNQYLDGQPCCDLNLADNDGNTALMRAVASKQFKMAQLLCNQYDNDNLRCNLNIANHSRQTVIDLAHGDEALEKLIWNKNLELAQAQRKSDVAAPRRPSF